MGTKQKQMKRLFLILFLFISIGVSSQSYKIVDGQLVEVKSTPKEKSYKDTGMTIVKDSIPYPVYKSVKNKYFIIRTSKKTGKEYKQYLKINE